MASLKSLVEKYHGEISPIHISVLAFAGLWFPPLGFGFGPGPGHGIRGGGGGGIPLRTWLPYAAATASSIFFVFMEMLGEFGALFKLDNITTEGISENTSYILVRLEVLIKLFQSIRYREEWQALSVEIDQVLKRHCLPAERKRVIEKARGMSDWYLLAFLATLCFTGFNVFMQRYITMLMGGTLDESHKLPVRFWLLTPGFESPAYELFVMIQFMSQIYTPFCLAAVDSYAYVLAVYTAQTLKVLQKNITSMPGRPENKPTIDWSAPEARPNFIKCVQFHRDLIGYSERVNKAFRFNFFCSVSATMLQLTGITLKLSAVPLGSTKFVAGLLVVIVIPWKAWVVCSASDMLVKESTAVATAIMESTLWSAPTDIVRQCSLMILRSQRAASFTAWKFFKLSPPVVLDMMKLSYRIFTVLRTMV